MAGESRFFATRLLAALLVLPPIGAAAWNKAGHEVTGVIAYRELQATAPDVVESISWLMEAHPDRSMFDKRIAEGGTDRGIRLERLFMLMATWPDEVRSRGRVHGYDRPTWHYTNLPYLPRPSEVPRQPIEGPEHGIFWAFRENMRVLTDPRETREAKAVALCWVFHLVGDVHQPLHTTSLFDATYPAGDRGGNLEWVRVRQTSRPIKLHAFWDDVLLGSSRPQSVRNEAAKLRVVYPPRSLRQLQESPYASPASFEQWGRRESHTLAITAAYDGGRLLTGRTASEAPALTVEYVSHAKEIAQQQVALAGYRLSYTLTSIRTSLR